MQKLYRNESSLTLRWLMLAAGAAILAVAALDAGGFWPVFGNNQNIDLTLLLPGSAMALIGLKEITSFVNEVNLDVNGNITVSMQFRQASLTPAMLRKLIIYAAGNDKRRLTLVSDGGSFSFPLGVFAADQFAETMKAINPLVEVVRRA